MAGIAEEVFAWSEKPARPAWWRTALRLLHEAGSITEEGLDALCEECFHADPAAERSHRSPAGADEASAPAAATRLRLRSLAGVRGVDAIHQESALGFGEQPLQLVYGDNGTGKSGYSRLLGRICWARGSGGRPPTGDVFAVEPAPAAGCSVAWSRDAQELNFEWDATSATDVPSDLRSVAIFDTPAADAYATLKLDVEFLPTGFHLVQGLTDACDAVRSRLIAKLAAAGPGRDLRQLRGDHPIGRIVDELGKPDAARRVAEVPAFSDADAENLQQLRAERAEADRTSPASVAATLSTRADRLRRMRSSLTAARGLADAEVVADVRQALAELQAATEASRLATEAAAGALPSGAGDPAWRVLWQAAVAFASTSSSGVQRFPEAAEGDPCPLCEQPLGVEPANRLRAFHAFIQEDAARKLAEARGCLQTLRHGLSQPRQRPEEAILEELDADQPPLAASVRAAVAAWEGRAEALRAACEACDSDRLDVLTQPPADPLVELEALESRLREERERVLERREGERAKELQREIEKLEALQRFDQSREDVLIEVRRLRFAARVEAAKQRCDTKTITALATALTKKHVTEAFCQAFGAELQRYGGDRLPVELKRARSSKGRSPHHLVLRDAEGVPVHHVLSEGELRCVSLAAFLAELSCAPTRAPLIFDDPVSSLGSRWREAIAQRLAEEAGRRQVIVFTHDLVFLLLLTEAAEKLGQEVSTQQLVRGPGGKVGLPREGPPWGGATTKQRIGALNAACQAAEKLHRTEPEDVYEAEARRIYGLLREAWERAVEEVMLNGAVQRHQTALQTKSLRDATARMTMERYDELDAAMAKCSGLLPGHDSTAASNAPTPPPAGLKADVAALAEWVKKLRDARP